MRLRANWTGRGGSLYDTNTFGLSEWGPWRDHTLNLGPIMLYLSATDQRGEVRLNFILKFFILKTIKPWNCREHYQL